VLLVAAGSYSATELLAESLRLWKGKGLEVQGGICRSRQAQSSILPASLHLGTEIPPGLSWRAVAKEPMFVAGEETSLCQI